MTFFYKVSVAALLGFATANTAIHVVAELSAMECVLTGAAVRSMATVVRVRHTVEQLHLRQQVQQLLLLPILVVVVPGLFLR